jgi:glycosyltransferase involved in cell wall biosynthesis
MRVLIDTFNTNVAQPRGIGTYARTLAQANHRIGNEVFLLTGDRVVYDQRLVAPSRETQPSFSQRDQPPWYIKNRLYSIRGLAHRVAPRTHVVKLRLAARSDLIDQALIAERLGYFDAIMNSPDLFNNALSNFCKHRQPTLIDAPIHIDVAHFTWCLPIRIKNASKTIYTIHDIIPLRFPYLTLDDIPTYYDLVSWCCRTADIIVTVSEHTRNEIIHYLGVPANKVVNTFQSVELSLDSTGFDADKISSQVSSLFGLHYGSYFVLVGPIEPRKNVARAIEARLTARTEFPLVICGPRTPFSSAELSLLDNPLLQDRNCKRAQRVIVLEYLPRHLLAMLMAGARAVLVPSITEGFGLPALEAMTLGTPVIASKSGALPEICGSAAIYIDAYETSALRNALDEVASLEPEDLTKLRAQAALQANRFSFQAYCSRLTRTYGAVSAC